MRTRSRGSHSGVLIIPGLTYTEPPAWSGSIYVEAGSLQARVGPEFRMGDVVHPLNRWQPRSHSGFVIARRLMNEQYFSTLDEFRILRAGVVAGDTCPRTGVQTEAAVTGPDRRKNPHSR